MRLTFLVVLACISATFTILGLAQRFAGWQSKALAWVLALCVGAGWVVFFVYFDLLPHPLMSWLILLAIYGLVGACIRLVKNYRNQTAERRVANLSDERHRIVRDELANFTAAERAALFQLVIAPMNEQSLRERLEGQGLAWTQDVSNHLLRRLVTRNFTGLFSVIEQYRDAIEETRRREANPGILSINTGAFRH